MMTGKLIKSVATRKMIEAKQADRVDRRNKVKSVRMLRDESSEFVTKAGVLELEEPDLLRVSRSISVRFLKWDRLPACQFQCDRVEAYPTN